MPQLTTSSASSMSEEEFQRLLSSWILSQEKVVQLVEGYTNLLGRQVIRLSLSLMQYAELLHLGTKQSQSEM